MPFRQSEDMGGVGELLVVPKGMEASNIAGRGHGRGGSGEPMNLRPDFPGTSLDLDFVSEGGRKEFHEAV